MLSRAKPLNAGVDVMGSTGTRFYRIGGVHNPPRRSIKRSQEAYEAQSVELRAVPAELYHWDHR
jgi:hypothetical protein